MANETIDLRGERVKRESDNRNVTPTDLLKLALHDLDDPANNMDSVVPNKALLLLLKSDGIEYQFHVYRSNLSLSESIALLDAVKHTNLKRLTGE